ncbi:hypothetical protein PQO03_11570 [Lentisphaera profundi]|uniref:Uncharacterized protein n=1 Tax=Lentisphaera profundi TaxID=1658616 RepID=A0ABY7VQ92_9BACT|nr:hypothetical protein [Lentisphaera profundi]WDE96348.1 hypothetical protein PQO03_11570 [Lentisphaera profundi]
MIWIILFIVLLLIGPPITAYKELNKNISVDNFINEIKYDELPKNIQKDITKFNALIPDEFKMEILWKKQLATMVLWRNKSQVILYTLPDNSITIETELSNSYSLTTYNNQASTNTPMPENYFREVYPKIPLKELIEKHKNSLDCIKTKKEIFPLDDTSEQNIKLNLFKGSLQIHKYVKSIPLYPLKAILWFYYYPFFNRYPSIESQLNKS